MGVKIRLVLKCFLESQSDVAKNLSELRRCDFRLYPYLGAV